MTTDPTTTSHQQSPEDDFICGCEKNELQRTTMCFDFTLIRKWMEGNLKNNVQLQKTH